MPTLSLSHTSNPDRKRTLQQSLRPNTTTSLTTEPSGSVTDSHASCWLSCERQKLSTPASFCVLPSMHMAGW